MELNPENQQLLIKPTYFPGFEEAFKYNSNQGSIVKDHLMRRIKSSMEERMKALRENRYLVGLDSQILDYLVLHTQLIS